MHTAYTLMQKVCLTDITCETSVHSMIMIKLFNVCVWGEMLLQERYLTVVMEPVNRS